MRPQCLHNVEAPAPIHTVCLNAGYSGTPLLRKLGIKPGMRVYFEGAPEGYRSSLGPLPAGVSVRSSLRGPLDLVHLFAMDRKRVALRFEKAMRAIEKDGILWVSWPKRASGVETDLDGGFVRAHGLESGLVDVKVCAVDETWSALKFVYRVQDR